MDTATTPTKATHNVQYFAVNQDVEIEHASDQQSTAGSRENIQTRQPDHLNSVYNRATTFWVNGWTSEVLSCTLAITALACLIATLKAFDGNVLTEMPLHISINTLIAIFTAVIKSSILLPVSEGISQLKWSWFSRSRAIIDFDRFDVASRGPWGSLLLVFGLQSRHLAAVGAWITILALAIDPFTQQMVRPVRCLRPAASSDMTRIARANNITGTGYDGADRMEGGMLRAVYTGLTSDVPVSPLFQCASGNCTFPTAPNSEATYQTIAIESACVNVTKEVKWYEDNSTSYFYLPRWGNYKTGTETDFREVLKTRGSKRYQFPQYWNGKSDQDSIYNFAALMWGIDWVGWNDTGISEGITDYMHPLAIECSLWPAVQTIAGSISQGKLQERVLSSERLSLSRERSKGEFDLLHVSSSVLRKGAWEPCSPSTSNSSITPVAIFNNSIWDYISDPDDAKLQWYAEDCVWYVGAFVRRALGNSLSNFYSNKTVELMNKFEDWSATTGDIWVRDLYQNGTLNTTVIEGNVARLAASMSAQIRTDATTRQRWENGIAQVMREEDEWGWVYGQATEETTCIYVHWPWLAFPASLVALTLAFVASYAWKTRQGKRTGQLGLWKSTSLAVLFGGLDERIREENATVNKINEMQQRAEGLKVSLRQTESGWRLVEGDEK